MSLSNIIASIDARLAELDELLRERERLVAARLTLTDAPAAPATPAERVESKKAVRRRQPKLTVATAIDGVRDAIADGPANMAAIHRALGRSPSPATNNVVRQVLEQLRAEQTRQGWVLPSPPASEEVTPAATSEGNGHARDAVRQEASQDELEQAYLERSILKQLATGPLLPVVLADMIDAPRQQVVQACEHLHVAGRLEVYADGRYSA